ncbi:MAG: cupin domain-containing protein [Pseudomonadota bacterium]
MSGATHNLLSTVLPSRDVEVVDHLLTADGVRLERIVSLGQASPDDFWYDQPEAEWVILLSGHARLRLAEECQDRDLRPGDAVYLPARCRHRVTWTDPTQPTVWLALFVDADLRPVMTNRFADDASSN